MRAMTKGFVAGSIGGFVMSAAFNVAADCPHPLLVAAASMLIANGAVALVVWTTHN